MSQEATEAHCEARADPGAVQWLRSAALVLSACYRGLGKLAPELRLSSTASSEASSIQSLGPDVALAKVGVALCTSCRGRGGGRKSTQSHARARTEERHRWS